MTEPPDTDELDVFQLAEVASGARGAAAALHQFADRLDACPPVRTTPQRMAATIRDLAGQYATMAADADEKAGLT